MAVRRAAGLEPERAQRHDVGAEQREQPVRGPAIVASSAACRPSASGNPAFTPSWNSASALPSGSRLSVCQSSMPSASSFLRSTAVGRPAASSATLTGRSFCRIDWSGERASTCVIETASRRGVANGVARLSAVR
jgi:hypothetical protein